MSKQARKFITDYVRRTKSPIRVVPGKCRYNFRCSYNAVHDAIENDQSLIVMVIYIDKDLPVIHFLNVDPDRGYVDNTLGHWSSRLEYYYVRAVTKEDFFNVSKIFLDYRKKLNRMLPFLIRIFNTETF